MLLLWLVSIVCLHVSANVKDVTNTGHYVPRYDEVCTNECSETDPRYWCGKNKEDAAGHVMRCVQYTRYGEICVAECGGKEKKYNWCPTNALRIANQGFQLGEGIWWEYCSLVGYTVKKEPCIDECGLNGERYFWCHTDKDHTSKWDYCSPPGLVKPVQYTVNLDECISECRQQGENYHWCTKSMDYCSEEGRCDWSWDYCSMDGDHSRYNYKCKEKCGNKGTSYYWCELENGGWDYCSPSAQLGVHKSDHVELTRYGIKCRDVCGLKGEKYYWCSQHGGDKQNWWDYCSPNQTITRYQEKCKDECTNTDNFFFSNFYWCHTDSSWDYCSPLYVPGGFEGHETVITTKLVTRVLIMLGGSIFFFFVTIACCLFIRERSGQH